MLLVSIVHGMGSYAALKCVCSAVWKWFFQIGALSARSMGLVEFCVVSV